MNQQQEIFFGLTYKDCVRLIRSQLPSRHRNDEDMLQDCLFQVMSQKDKYLTIQDNLKPSTFVCKATKFYYLNHFRQLKKNSPSDPNFEFSDNPDHLANQFQSSSDPYQLILLKQLVPTDIDLDTLSDAEIKLLAKSIRIKLGLQLPDEPPSEVSLKISETMKATIATKRRMEKRRMKISGFGLDHNYRVNIKGKTIFKSPSREECVQFIENY